MTTLVPQFVEAKKTYLNSPITDSDTSFVLNNLVDLYGIALITADFGIFGYLTLDPGGDSEEIISFTTITQNSDGTATISGVVRGLLGKSPYSTGGVATAHYAGTIVVVSNNPQIYNALITYIAAVVAGTVGTATNLLAGILKLSLAAAVPGNPIAVGDNDPRVPTQDENNALPGTSTSSPNSSNHFVDSADVSDGSAIDQTQLTQNATVTLGEADSTTKHAIIAQSFIPAKNPITGFQFYKSADTGTFTGTVKFALQADSSGSPSGSDLASVTLSNGTWTGLSTGFNQALFSASYIPTLGSLYWIVITTSTNDNANHPNLGTNSAGGYGNGSIKFKNTTDGWVAISTIDLAFKTLTALTSRVVRYGTDGSIPNSYISDTAASGTTYTGTMNGLTAYYEGLKFFFKLATTVTGASTLNLNGLGAVALKKAGTAALVANDYIAGQIVEIVKDGTNFQITTPSALLLVTPGSANGAFTKDISSTTTTTIAHGLGKVPSILVVEGWFMTGSAFSMSKGFSNGSTQNCVYLANNSNIFANSSTSTAGNIAHFSNGTNPQDASYLNGSASLDATNITITWSKTNTPTGTANCVWSVM